MAGAVRPSDSAAGTAHGRDRGTAGTGAQRHSWDRGTAGELIRGCWKENQSSRKAALHVASHPALAAASTEIPVHPCALPMGQSSRARL